MWSFITESCTGNPNNTFSNPKASQLFDVLSRSESSIFSINSGLPATVDRHSIRNNRQMQQFALPYLVNGYGVSVSMQDRRDYSTVNRLNDLMHYMKNEQNAHIENATGKKIYLSIQYVKTQTHEEHKEIFDRIDAYKPEAKNSLLCASLTTHTKQFIRVWPANRGNYRYIVVFTNTITPTVLLKLFAALPIMAPGVLDGAKFPVPDELFYALGKMDTEAYVKQFDAWYNQFAPVFEETYIRTVYESAFNEFSKQRAVRLERDLNAVRSNIRSTENTLDEMYAKLDRLNDMLLSARYLNGADDFADDIKYFSKKPQIKNFAFDGRKFIMHLAAPCEYYDKNTVQTLVNSTRNNSLNGPLKKFFERVFISEEFTLYFTTKMIWQVADSGANYAVDVAGGYNFGDMPQLTMPNPHHFEFGCLGGYHNLIVKALSNQDLIMALEQSIAACSTLSFSDGTVIGKLCERLLNSSNWYDRSCVKHKESGIWFTPRELYTMTDAELDKAIKAGTATAGVPVIKPDLPDSRNEDTALDFVADDDDDDDDNDDE